MPYASVTRATLRARLTERVGNNSVFWIDAEKNDAINEAISVWQALTGEWTGTATVATSPGVTYYTIPDPIVSAQRISISGGSLVPTTLFELDNGFPGWENTTNPQSVPTYWAPLGFNQLAVYPTPDGIYPLDVEGIKEAPWLTADGDFIDIGEEELNQILAYAHHYLTFKEGGVELQSSLSLLQGFLEAAALRNGRLKYQAFYIRAMGRDRESLQRQGVQPPNPDIGARN